jgi:hypothetical protein
MSPLGHTLVAARVLDEARANPGRYPAEVGRIAADPVLRAHFLGGAVAPDLITTAGRPLGPQVHRGLPGAWALSLLKQAQNPAERAYALGWITHLAADRALHPFMIARGLDADGRAADHVTFETALDVLVAAWAKDYSAATLLGGHRHAEALVGRVLGEIEGGTPAIRVEPWCGLRVAGTAVHLDGAALAKCGRLGRVKPGAKAPDPGGILAAIARLSTRRAVTDPESLKLAPDKEITQLFIGARSRSHALLTFASRAEWDPLNVDLETGGAPAAGFRPASAAAAGFYYAVGGTAEDRGREPEVMRHLTRRGHGNVLMCRGLPPADGGIIRVVRPPGLGDVAPAGADFTPICIGPYGSREHALKALVDLKDAAQAAYREATGHPSPGLVVAEPRYAF